MGVPESAPKQLFEFNIPKDGEVAHLSFIPGEVKTALNGLQVEAQKIQRDHIGYPQFVALEVDELIKATQETEKENAATWLEGYVESRGHVPEQEKRVIYFPVKAGNLVEVRTVE